MDATKWIENDSLFQVRGTVPEAFVNALMN